MGQKSMSEHPKGDSFIHVISINESCLFDKHNIDRDAIYVKSVQHDCQQQIMW